MKFNYRKLSGRIVEIFGTRAAFAEAMGWSERTLSLKMNNKVEWSQRDMFKAADLLGITYTDISLYFFALEVQNIEQEGDT